MPSSTGFEDAAASAESRTRPFSVSLESNTNQTDNNTTSDRPRFTLQTRTQHKQQPSANRSRPAIRLANGNDSEDDNDDREHSAAVEVSGFDTVAGGAIRADGVDPNKKRELVIKVESRNNWRNRPGVNTSRRRRNLLPPEVQAAQQNQNDAGRGRGHFDREGPSMQYGLSFAQPHSEEVEGVNEDVAMADAAASTTEPEAPAKLLTQDEIALQALISESKGDSTGRKSDLVIESTSGHTNEEENRHYDQQIYDETSTFRADVVTRPDPASLDAYNAVPVEEFGAALLRGMGWKEGQAIGRGRYDTSSTASTNATRPRIPERRPGFLGIGAKDMPGKAGGAEAEIGAWGKAAMRKANRKNNGEGDPSNTDGLYMPVLMKSKKTGEFLTEEEFRERQLPQKSAASSSRVDESEKSDEWRERRDRNLERDGRDRSRRHDRDRNRDRDRNQSPDRDHDRRGYRKYNETDRSYRDRSRDRDRKYRDREGDKVKSRYGDDDRHRRSSGLSSSSRRDRERERERGREYDRNSDRESHIRRDR